MSHVPGPVQRRRAASVPAPWSPSDLGGALAFWAEARGSDLWQDTGKTIPASGDTDPARIWTPRSPAVDLAAPSDGARPTYRATGLGGGRGVLYDRTDDCTRSDSLAGLTGAQTWILRWSWDGVAAPRVLAGQVAAGPTNNELWIRTSVQLRIGFGEIGTATATIYAAVPALGTGAHTTVITWDGVSPSALSSYTVTHDGAACSLSAGATITRPTATTSARTTIGARNDDTASSFFGGHVGLFIVASGVLTGGDLSNAVAYADGWL